MLAAEAQRALLAHTQGVNTPADNQENNCRTHFCLCVCAASPRMEQASQMMLHCLRAIFMCCDEAGEQICRDLRLLIQ